MQMPKDQDEFRLSWAAHQNMPTLKVKVQHNIFTDFIMFTFALGLLQSAVISLYTVYLTWSALLYNPG